MKAAIYHGRRDVRVEQVPDPGAPPPDSVLLEVTRASLCGTDIGEFIQGPRMIPLHDQHRASGHRGPLIIGHEFTGRVAAVGDAVTELSVGDRVVPGAASWCGSCPRCLEGRPNLCEQYFVYGLHADGGLAELVTVPAAMCHRVPDECCDDAAAIAQPLAIALHAIRRSGAGLGSSVAVIGVGGIGSFLIAAAARVLRPAPLIAVDLDPARLSLAETLGADIAMTADQPTELADEVHRLTRGQGVDLAIEASGTSGGLELAVSLVRHGGRVHLVGLPTQSSSLDLHDCIVHEIDFSSSNGHVCGEDIPEALELLTNGGLATAVTDRVIAIDRLVPDGLEPMAAGRTHGKVVVAVAGAGR